MQNDINDFKHISRLKNNIQTFLKNNSSDEDFKKKPMNSRCQWPFA